MFSRLMCTVVVSGNVVGIGGLQHHVLKTATLSSTLACPSLSAMYFQTIPLVKVAVSARNVADLPALERGLNLLNQVRPDSDALSH